MIKTYQIKGRPEFKSAFLDSFTLCEQLAGDDAEQLCRKMHTLDMTNEPLLPVWGAGASSTFRVISPVSERIPDISPWDGTSLLLNGKAYDLLKNRLNPEGEWLPITVNGESMHIFHCLAAAKEREELCVRRYFQGQLLDGVETLYFDDEDVANRFLFVSKLEGFGTLFCSSHFKALIEELGLEGLRFDEDLLDPF